MSLTNFTTDQGKTELDKLIETGIISQHSNNFITLPNDTHKYRYDPSKELSKILFKNFSSYYIKDMPKRLNKKTAIIPLKKVEIQKEDGDEWIPPLDRYRTWVVKETFAFINLRFADTQQTQVNGSDIEFRMHVVVMSLTKPNRITTKTFFSGIKTIYGGDEGLKLYLKTEIIKSIYAYEDSDYEIQSIAIQQLYIQNAKQYDKIKLGDIKMYNAVFDYTGYGLKATTNEIANTCVPSYILNLFNNKEETNKEKKYQN